MAAKKDDQIAFRLPLTARVKFKKLCDSKGLKEADALRPLAYAYLATAHPYQELRSFGLNDNEATSAIDLSQKLFVTVKALDSKPILDDKEPVAPTQAAEDQKLAKNRSDTGGLGSDEQRAKSGGVRKASREKRNTAD